MLVFWAGLERIVETDSTINCFFFWFCFISLECTPQLLGFSLQHSYCGDPLHISGSECFSVHVSNQCTPPYLARNPPHFLCMPFFSPALSKAMPYKMVMRGHGGREQSGSVDRKQNIWAKTGDKNCTVWDIIVGSKTCLQNVKLKSTHVLSLMLRPTPLIDESKIGFSSSATFT